MQLFFIGVVALGAACLQDIYKREISFFLLALVMCIPVDFWLCHGFVFWSTGMLSLSLLIGGSCYVRWRHNRSALGSADPWLMTSVALTIPLQLLPLFFIITGLLSLCFVRWSQDKQLPLAPGIGGAWLVCYKNSPVWSVILQNT